MRNILRTRLNEAVEGKALGNFGYCINVLEVEVSNIGLGEIDEDTGSAIFHLKYTAILFMPFFGEVLDGIVKVVDAVRYI